MTQLDRLEALANESVTWGLSPKHMELWTAFPNLIRVARAANLVHEAILAGGPDWRRNRDAALYDLFEAYIPLFAEVES